MGPPPFGLPPFGFGLTPIGLGLPPIGLPPIGLPPIGLTLIGLPPIRLTPIGLTPIWTDPQDQIGGISNGGGPTFKIWLGIIIFKIRVIKDLNYPHLVKMKLVQLGVVQ